MGQTGKNLGVSKEMELGRKVMALASRGASNVEIAVALDINRKTVARLKRKFAEEVFTDADRDEMRAEILQSYHEVKKRAWQELDRKIPEGAKGDLKLRIGERWINPTSHNLPKLLDNILSADANIVKLMGLNEPEEVHHEVRGPLERTRAYEEHKARQREGFELIQGGADDDSSDDEAAV